MKRAPQVAQTQKIYNCVDELLLQDVDYQFELDKREQEELQNHSAFKRSSKRHITNFTAKSSLKGVKSMISPDRESKASMKRTAKNLFSLNASTKGLKPNQKVQFPTHKINIVNQKGDKSSSSINSLKIGNGLKLKRTVSCDPNQLHQIKQNELQLQIEGGSDNSFIAGQKEGSPMGLLSPNNSRQDWRQSRKMKHSLQMFESFKEVKKRESRKKRLENFSKSLGKSVSRFSLSPPSVKNANEEKEKDAKEFHLTHDELEFLSLLYPNETPEELMIKLLSYYEQQVQYKNSFHDIAFRQQKQKKNYFFKSNADLTNQTDDRIKEDDKDEEEMVKGFAKMPKDSCVNEGVKEENLNEYTRLKEECLAALGSQMIETQIKSSIVETANVNYYTRQYAMPVILEVIEEKNAEAQVKLEKLLEGSMTYELGNSANLPHSDNNFPPMYTSSNYPEQYIHKVYIPANSRGQCFQMDYQPKAKLFDYLSENDYRRILRDINHLIQKVLLYHRHNSFLKKKNNSLLKGWNLVLIVLLVFILSLLYIQSCFQFQKNSSYIEIVSYFSLSFLLILILGNAFNNYKKSIKRSSLIKDICEEITNYLEFANCSSKNIKWVLGKDFFWLQIWVYLRRCIPGDNG